MFDIKLIREKPEEVQKNLERRKDPEKIKLLQKTINLDKEWRELKHEEDQIRSKRNQTSKLISEAKKTGKDPTPILEEAKKIPEQLKKIEEKRLELEKELNNYLKSIPNMLHDSVPYGKDDTENVELKKIGKPKKQDFELKPHQEIAENLGVADFERSAKIAGHGFYFLKGDLALLNQAIIRFSVDELIKKGYTYVEPPLMMNREAYETGVSMADFENVMYKIEGENTYLIATSEHPLLAQYKDETLQEDELPIKLIGYSMCFRREVGSRGIDTKGLFRTHQFNKVEQIILCKPEESWKYHEEIQKNAEELYEKLELPYRVVNICTGDIGDLAAKKYDIETWMPRQKEYKETGSNSNFTDYHARRANIKMHRKQNNTYEYLHTLNNTALATSRIMVAILENYQEKDGSVTIPKALQPYMYGKTKLETIKK
ncbi:serine--tRNA ligase [Candidatus Woesearchaeota archaeon]|nr:serine--tRNA ligase [Candidatus Woesearchaeota archaeon]